MDPRHSTQHPFSRPPSHQAIRESQFAPIPPPPYSSQQSTMPTDSLHGNDPFLRRRNEHDNYRTSPPISNPTQPYTLSNTPSYTTSPLFTPTIRDTQLSRTSYGNGRPERFTTQRSESGTCLRLLCLRLLNLRSMSMGMLGGTAMLHFVILSLHHDGTTPPITASPISSSSSSLSKNGRCYKPKRLRSSRSGAILPWCASVAGFCCDRPIARAYSTSPVRWPAHCAKWHHRVHQPILVLT